MKLIKIGDVYHVQFKPGRGRRLSVMSTRCRTKEDAEQMVKDARIQEIEYAAKAGALTMSALSMVAFGGRTQDLNCMLRCYKDWMTALPMSDATIRGATTVISTWMRGDIEKLSPTEVTEKHVGSFVNRTGEQMASTRKAELNIIRRFFRWMMNNGCCHRNPAQLVRVDFSKLSHGQKEMPKRPSFTDEEYAKILAVVDADTDDTFWRFSTRIGRMTALRISDVAQLEWESLAVPGKFVVWMEKTNTRIEIPLSAELQALIASIPKEDEKYVFPNERHTYRGDTTRSNLSVQFGRICKRAGVVGSFHSLRRMCLTKIVEHGGTMEDAKKQAGHASVKTTELYISSKNSIS